MHFSFNDKKIEGLYLREEYAKDYPADVIANFFEVMAIIEGAKDERDFYAMKSLHFEKLAGKLGKEDKRSMRLTKQWRLIVSLSSTTEGKYLLVLNIDKHSYR